MYRNKDESIRYSVDTEVGPPEVRVRLGSASMSFERLSVQGAACESRRNDVCYYVSVLFGLRPHAARHAAGGMPPLIRDLIL